MHANSLVQQKKIVQVLPQMGNSRGATIGATRRPPACRTLAFVAASLG